MGCFVIPNISHRVRLGGPSVVYKKWITMDNLIPSLTRRPSRPDPAWGPSFVRSLAWPMLSSGVVCLWTTQRPSQVSFSKNLQCHVCFSVKNTMMNSMTIVARLYPMSQEAVGRNSWRSSWRTYGWAFQCWRGCPTVVGPPWTTLSSSTIALQRVSSTPGQRHLPASLEMR